MPSLYLVATLARGGGGTLHSGILNFSSNLRKQCLSWRGPRKGERFFRTLFLTLILSCRKKLTQKLAETEEALSSASQKASNAEKAKNRLNSELEDALIDLEKVS